jgi:hypothetical protein
MSAHLLHCDGCGRERWANYKDLDLNWRDAIDVEKYAGKCACSGSFKVNAPPRCPQCKSSDVLLDIAVNGLHYEEFYD